ncbi:MAG: hypothetical protein M3Y55_18600 [Pseudomonadota bacterium]|nr:hypothetical protein [Pseudomonadota bacterium]
MIRIVFIVAIGCLAASAASAQTVYRCGSEYTHVPCADGRLIDVSDPVTAERRAEAHREERLGQAMARERRAEASVFRPAMAANIGPAKAAATKAPATTKKKAKAKKRLGETDDGDFIARVPQAKRATG